MKHQHPVGTPLVASTWSGTCIVRTLQKILTPQLVHRVALLHGFSYKYSIVREHLKNDPTLIPSSFPPKRGCSSKRVKTAHAPPSSPINRCGYWESATHGVQILQCTATNRRPARGAAPRRGSRRTSGGLSEGRRRSPFYIHRSIYSKCGPLNRYSYPLVGVRPAGLECYAICKEKDKITISKQVCCHVKSQTELRSACNADTSFPARFVLAGIVSSSMTKRT